MDTDIPWDAPAKLYHRVTLGRGVTRSRADMTGTFKQCVVQVRSGSAGPVDGLVIVLDDGTAEIAGNQIQGLIDRL